MIAVAALAAGISCLCVAFVGASTRAEHLQWVESNKPRPTPQMMAPRETRQPEVNHGGRVSYALIDPSYVSKGGY